ncbi:hypothetical protein E1287_37620 [Actinomadura sp. KC06]|uniref:hypothetical protein n=1 Tax=Actinomadura sp. KC06 TaxID=2530369 RepID=UPI0010502A5B|nr:hypothetical protein [Actinomadura sp. KC06]TDD25053.1 hypothetical protein E1287_37620 [Actinomadura sp. KC06]
MPQSVRMTWNGDLADERARAGAERGVALAVEHLLGASRQVVPLEEATLERSGVATTDGLEGAVSFDTPYAVIQHERLDFRHDEGRTAKYLEGPALEEADAMRDLIAAQVRRALR